MKYIIVFLAVTLVDIIWALYIKAIAQNAVIRAGITATAIYILGEYAILAYTESPIYIIPATLGAFIGTILTVYWNKKEDEKSTTTGTTKQL